MMPLIIKDENKKIVLKKAKKILKDLKFKIDMTISQISFQVVNNKELP